MAYGGVSEVEIGTDETFEFLCTVCAGKNKITEAFKFCVDCQDYFCSSCVKHHNEFPILRGHKILEKAQFQAASRLKFPSVHTERCKVHGYKPVDMYCRQHDAIGCTSCMLLKHSSCKDKHYVPEYVENNAKVVDSQEVTAKLDAICKLLEELQNAFIKEKGNLQSGKENSLEKIRQFRAEINKQLDALEKHSVEEVEQKFKSLMDKIEDPVKELQESITNVQTAQDSLKSAGDNKSHMFVCIKMASDIASNAKQKLDSNKFYVSPSDILFVADQELQAILNKMKDLGSIQSQLKSPDLFPQVSRETTEYESRKNQSNLPLLQVKGNKSYNVKVESDKNTCDIYSACTLEDGTVILADFGNNKLKSLDSSCYNVRDFCEVPEHPYQVCVICNQEVAVSCTTSKLIQFVTFGSTVKKIRQINTGFKCQFLAYGDGKLFVTDNTSVYLYTVLGERLQQLGTHQTRQGLLSFIWTHQSIFSYLTCLTVSSDNSKIYVSDITKGLLILDRSGPTIGQFSGAKLHLAAGICRLKNDNVLVCGCLSQNVLQFSSTGKMLGEVLKNVGKCVAVCCDQENLKLIVGLNMSDEIKIYDII